MVAVLQERPDVDARDGTLWGLGALAVTVACLTAPFGQKAGIASLIVLALAVLAGRGRTRDTAWTFAAVGCLLLVALGSAELFNGNVPSMHVGLLGYRKSMVFVLGLLLGLVWKGSKVAALRLIWLLLTACLLVSIALHLGAPHLEQSITRTASQYTATFNGQSRMQGIFAGPFHVALASVFVVIAAARCGDVLRSRLLRVSGAGIGVAALVLSQVRTGIVACAVGLLLTFLIPRAKGRVLKRLMIGGVVLFAGGIFAAELSSVVAKYAALNSLVNSSGPDQRFTDRYATWHLAWHMISARPLTGWGSGSAGDTLDAFYGSVGHVTSHNLFLKYGVEDGVPGFLLIVGVLLTLLVVLVRRGDPTGFGLAAAVPLLVFGMTDSTVEALPPAMMLAAALTLAAFPKETVRERIGR